MRLFCNSALLKDEDVINDVEQLAEYLWKTLSIYIEEILYHITFAVSLMSQMTFVISAMWITSAVFNLKMFQFLKKMVISRNCPLE